MDEFEDIHADWTNIYFYDYKSWGRGLGTRKTSLNPHPQYFIADRSKAVLS